MAAAWRWGQRDEAGRMEDVCVEHRIFYCAVWRRRMVCRGAGWRGSDGQNPGGPGVGAPLMVGEGEVFKELSAPVQKSP